MASTSLSTAVSHAIRFLTAKLGGSYSPSTLLKLQSALDTNLSAHYAPSWNPADPIRGSGRRCLTLSPSGLPPRPIWTACTAANVQWFDWIALLGNKDLDLFVDPGCVAIRAGAQIITIWSADASLPSTIGTPRKTKTFAQRVGEADRDEEEQLFSMLNEEIKAPSWMTPIPAPRRSGSPLSESEHSRCSSRSSNSSSSGFSHYSGDTTSSRTSASATGSPKSSGSGGAFKQSRRERARQARVFIDTNKKEVTPYDGGKTTVLTGGVMLGGGPTKSMKTVAGATPATSDSASWRSARA